MAKETMDVTYQEKGRKVKEIIDISNMNADEMFEEVKRITGKGDWFGRISEQRILQRYKLRYAEINW